MDNRVDELEARIAELDRMVNELEYDLADARYDFDEVIEERDHWRLQAKEISILLHDQNDRLKEFEDEIKDIDTDWANNQKDFEDQINTSENENNLLRIANEELEEDLEILLTGMNLTRFEYLQKRKEFELDPVATVRTHVMDFAYRIGSK